MSHLLNSFKAWMWPTSPGIISLGFRGNTIVAVRVLRNGDAFVVTHIAEEKLSFIPFASPNPSEEDCALLTQSISRFAELIPQTYWPLQIALPDPASIVQVMQFDILPDAVHERESIAKFRLEKEFPLLKQMECTTQDISKLDKPGLLLATFIQHSWLACLKNACRNAGYVPSVIDTSVSYLFNRFYDVVLATQGDGVLIVVEECSWSILIWDGDHRPQFVRSRWLDKDTDKNDEYEHVVHDVERLILSYVLRVHSRQVGNIYLCANEVDRVLLSALLDKRLKIPCVQLDAAKDFSMAQGLSIQNVPAGLLAAVVPRL